MEKLLNLRIDSEVAQLEKLTLSDGVRHTKSIAPELVYASVDKRRQIGSILVVARIAILSQLTECYARANLVPQDLGFHHELRPIRRLA